MKGFLIRLCIFAFFAIILISVIAYARGYRLGRTDSTTSGLEITSTGIMAVSSNPKAAKVYVNGALKGVTDLNFSLPPGDYKIEVKKDGYTDWTKQVKLKGEIVMSLDALLFPRNPSLSPLTTLGVVKAIPFDQADKVVLLSQNGDTEKDGIYVFDSSKHAISFLPPLTLIALKKDLPTDVDFASASAYFSPDSQQAIFEFPTETTTYSYLFSMGEQTTQPFDVSSSKDTLLQAWDAQKNKEVLSILDTFPKLLRPIALEDFSIISFSPDKTKILYQAKTDITLPPIITPPLIGTNQTPEERDLKKGSLYIYDKKEDKNFKLTLDKSALPSPTLSPTEAKRLSKLSLLFPTPTPIDILNGANYPVLWYDDSKHLAIQQDHDIVMIDYDSTNKHTVYAGPFEKNFFFITSDGRMFILSNLNPQYNKYGDLFEVGIR